MRDEGIRLSASPMPKRPHLDGVKEGLRAEFKTSLFYSAGKEPQVQVIAKTIAAFMNAQGGNLYIGVDDEGYVVGLDGDRRALKSHDERTFVKCGEFDDSNWDYTTALLDAFQRKINAIVECYLGKAALRYVSEVEEESVEDVPYLRIPICKATDDVAILFKSGRWTELWVRGNGQKYSYKDVDRDGFIERRAKDLQAQLDERQLLQLQKNHKEEVSRLIDAHRQELDRIRKGYSGWEEKFRRIYELISDKSDVPEALGKSERTDIEKANDSQDFAQHGREKLKALLDDMRAKAEADCQVEAVRIERKQEEDRVKLIEALNAIAARTKASQENQRECLVFEHGYDSTTATTVVMDEFEEIRDGACVYSRLELKKYGEGLSFIPYDHKWEGDCCASGYVRVAEVDFKIAELVLIIRRSEKEVEDLGGGFSFSDLKKGYTGSLASSIWKSVTSDVCQKPDGAKCEIMLKNPLPFRAHTSESFSSRRVGDPNRYEVVGVRFVKQKLLFCPPHLTEEEHRGFMIRNALLAIIQKKLGD